MQEEIDSSEFSEWLWADKRGELPDAYDTFGMVAAAVMNAGFRYPKVPVGKEDFRPKLIKPGEPVDVVAKLVTPPDYSEFIWKT
jgi:hypothetical protein